MVAHFIAFAAVICVGGGHSGPTLGSVLRGHSWYCSEDHMGPGDQTMVSHVQGKHLFTVVL